MYLATSVYINSTKILDVSAYQDSVGRNVRAWINDYTHVKHWNIITHPHPYFKSDLSKHRQGTPWTMWLFIHVDYIPCYFLVYRFQYPGAWHTESSMKKVLHVHTWFKHHPRFYMFADCVAEWKSPDSKVRWDNMGPIWGRQDQSGPNVGPMNFYIWVYFAINQLNSMKYHRFVVNHIKTVFVGGRMMLVIRADSFHMMCHRHIIST